MIQSKLPTLESTVSGSTAAHLFTPHTESPVLWLLELATPNAPEKGGETIEEMFKQLPPHVNPNCVLHLLTNETIDEAISRIATSKGM